jgi:PQQ-dependent catabolism-associated CXXCW motif protein
LRRRCATGTPLRNIALTLLMLTGIAGIGARGEEGPGQAASTSIAPPEPAHYRTDDYRSPTPSTLQGATVVSSADAMTLWKAHGTLFIDVLPSPRKPDKLPPQTLWHVPEHLNIPGSVWLPNTGAGVLAPPAAAYFRDQLQRLTGGDRMAPLLFYCLRDCWMSWNAAKRAIELGYGRVTWFPDGTDGWTEIGGPLQPCEPAEPVP